MRQKFDNWEPSPLSRHCAQVDKIVSTKAYLDRIQSSAMLNYGAYISH